MKTAASEKVLIVSTNWIGDAIMSMPALQLFRQAHPAAEITVLMKPGLKALWLMHPAADHFQTLEEMVPTIGKLRQAHFDRAYVFPNSFRSAFLPFMAGVPRRIGPRGHWRRLMLTEIVNPPDGHQQFEYLKILGVQGEPPAPQLNVPEESFQSLEEKLGNFLRSGKPVITLLPGAARGPSKRWPAEHFIRLAKKLRAELGAQILLGGGPDDAAACAAIAAEAGPDVISLAGRTTIPEWAALLKMSDCVVSNDSGGMHLATAVGTPVAAIFGFTDPKKTGPLGRNAVVQKSRVRARDVARDSDAARLALAAVTPDEVFAAVAGLLNG
ncbi:MAG: lipopolysaccharide heptosyltransferase II [Kiritimatiellales bacterium]|jgi:heptosyltransferase-2